MENIPRPKHSLDDPIYTLAQSGTDNNSLALQIPNIVVNGIGTDVSNPKDLHGKAKRKMMTQFLIRCLVDVAKENNDLEQAKKYWNAWHCQSKLIKANGRTYGNYCKNRFCLVCLANRKAKMINKYYPTLSQWENPYFVTLTIKSVPAYKLNKWIKDGMIKGFRLILDRCKKRHQRGKGIKIMGVKSLECNYNPIKKTYNPHYHLIVPNKAIAELLKKEWQIQWTSQHTYKGAQHIRPITDIERDLIETIKYGSKIFTEPDMIKKAKSKIPPKIYAAALHNIFVAMRGHQLFNSFGFTLDKVEHTPKIEQQRLVNYETIEYDILASDWINYDTGELITGFIPSGKLEYLMKNNIDKNMT